MRLAVATLLLTLMTVAAVAQEYALPAHPVYLRWHVRAGHPENSTARWGIRWQGADSLSYAFACVETAGASSSDDVSGHMYIFTSGSVCNGNERMMQRRKFICGGYQPLSLMFTAARDGGEVTLASAGKSETIVLDIVPDTLRYLAVEKDPCVAVVADRLHCDSVPVARYRSVQEVDGRLAASRDPRERRWTYFDRNTDPLRSRLGGRYVVATISDDAGAYDIVYLDGATENTAEWTPGRIKGRLSPTTVPGVYDLLWFQSDGSPIDSDTSAALDDTLLTLSFPRWKATIRFRSM